jgi:hypothetical protein
MTFVVDGTNGLTFNDATTQASTATNASNISSGTLGKARLPTGSVLQVQSVYLTSATQLTSSGALHELSTSLRIAFTPVSSSSTLYFDVFGSFMYPNSSTLQYAAIYDVTNSAYVNLPPANGSRQRVHWVNRTAPFDVNDANSMNFSITVANTNTTARTYTIYHGTESASAQFLVSTLSSSAGVTIPITFKITEISA